MDNRKDEVAPDGKPKVTLEEQLKRRGIKEVSPDHEIYSMPWSVEFVPPGQRNSPSTPPDSKPESEATTQPREIKTLSPEERQRLWALYSADLTVVLCRPRPHLNSIRLILKRASVDGLDWRELYQKGVWKRQTMPWLTDSPPSLEDVNPEGYDRA